MTSIQGISGWVYVYAVVVLEVAGAVLDCYEIAVGGAMAIMDRSTSEGSA